jgi:hypothetical protein
MDLLDWFLHHTLFHGFDTLGSHLREEGSLDYDGGFVRLQVNSEHTASRYQNDMLMQYQIRKKGPYKNLSLIARFVLCLSVAFGFFFFSFVTPSDACSPKALHDQQYRLETLRDWIFVIKTYKYCTKGPAWSAIPIRNTKRLNFCENNL